MEFFKCYLRAIGVLKPVKVDFIAELPLEISQLILRNLDPVSLLTAARISHKWLEVCKSDSYLRRTARVWTVTKEMLKECALYDLYFKLKHTYEW